MSNIDKRALREAAEKVTALNLDTAQEARQEEDECIECPACGGDGYMEVQRDYCNIDGVALGVLFYGIGEHHGLAEAFFRAANPATMLALLDELEAEQRISSTWRKTAESNREKLEAAEKRIAELEEREKTLRTVGVMSKKAFERLEGRESRFIALWPRPEIYLPRKRPDDGVIVYARVAGTAKGE
ncbi:ead/Ea22-like family protein [Enterobacter asburiae]